MMVRRPLGSAFSILTDKTQMNSTGKYFDGYQPLIFPLAATQRSKEDTLILGCGSSKVNNIKTGKWLKASFFGLMEFPAAVRFSSLSMSLRAASI